MNIELIAPHDCGAVMALMPPDGAASVKLEICGENGEKITADYPLNADLVDVTSLLNGVKFTVKAVAYNKDGTVLDRSCERIFMPNYVPGKCVAYVHPYDAAFDPAGRFFGSPSVVKLENGDIIVSHDIFAEPAPNRFNTDFSDRAAYDVSITKIYKSEDNGRTFKYLSDIHCCTFGKLFSFKNKLYIVGLFSSDGAVLADPYNLDERNGKGSYAKGGLGVGIFCSDDGGRTWSEGTRITDAGNNANFHKAATPVVECCGRLWLAFDTPKDPKSGFGISVASVSVDDDIMDSGNWTVAAPFAHYDENWDNTVDGVWPYMLEEANIVKSKDNKLYVYARYNSVKYDDEFIKKEDDGLRAAVFAVNTEDFGAPLRFVEMQHFIGGLSKFTINYDEVTGKHYALVSRATEVHCCQRNILSLVSSADLKNWKIERDCLNIMDLNWNQNCQEAGMYYCDWVFDGDDIIAVCRTALHDCINYHDSNMITFHRFTDFREKNYNF